MDALRQIKSEEELEYLEKAEAIGDLAFEKILTILKPGMTELEVAAELEYQMKKAGAENFSFSTIVASGLNSSMPHAIPGEKKLEEGDFVTMDFGCTYKGYCSDMTRTVVLGKASEKQKEIYNTVLKAQLAALDAIKAGVTGKSVDKVARDIITGPVTASASDMVWDIVWDCLFMRSRDCHRQERTVLEENMIETVEPGIYVPGFGGVRIEDMVAVTKDGCKNFTHSPKELIEIPVK